MREQVRWWLRAAQRDLERAERSLQDDDRAAATFWAQQAAEKALKALLLHYRGYYPKTHSIRRLLEELGIDLGLSVEELEDAYELTQYYHLSRYPDIVEGLPDEAISRRTARKAVETARKIVARAAEALGGITEPG
ncbi:MAG: HEPN domain-containing protein [Desulfurococcales archaeon]|nr:HEPN domain-containing protein [Desulfurococcales archaeon]